jgi:hypothetical protein
MGANASALRPFAFSAYSLPEDGNKFFKGWDMRNGPAAI